MVLFNLRRSSFISIFVEATTFVKAFIWLKSLKVQPVWPYLAIFKSYLVFPKILNPSRNFLFAIVQM